MSTPVPENLALKAKASASEDFGPNLRPEFANDGNESTRWSGISGHNSGVWFQLDWRKPVTLRQIVIQQYDTFVKELDVQVWDAAKGDWRTLQHFGKPDEKLPLVVVATFDPVETTRVRIANITNGPSFTEVEAYSEPVPPTTALGSDANGNVIAMVCDRWGRAPIEGANVTLEGRSSAGPWRSSAVSDSHGLVQIPMPLGLHGPLKVRTKAAGFDYERTQPSEDLQYGLTPVGHGQKVTSLDGKWRFSVDPPADFAKPDFDDSKWSDIDVPAHWEMQGFRSLKGVGGYRRRFIVPAGEGRLKLRFDGVYSGAEVWLNGERIAYHEGGALPFEVDVTDRVGKGENVLALRVTEHTPTSDLLDHMSQYADVPLGGIMRKVTLFRVPDTHVGAYAIATPFQPGYVDATIAGTVSVVNESPKAVSGSLDVGLVGPDGKAVPVRIDPIPFETGPWARAEVPISVPVKAPKQWNAEQPNLYKLVFELTSGGKVVQSLTRRIGFRQTEIKGPQILVNGRPVKIRGTCHHDSDPLLGRAVTPALEKLDLELMKEANLNAIRTSHYPPIPEMIDFADELGIYVEDEGSFCWTGATNDLRLTPRVMQLNCELVARDRNHPSVTFWSICNESDIGFGLWRSREWIQKADPSRPTTGTYHADDAMDIAVRHNPITAGELDDIEKNLRIPTIWDECWCIWQDIWGDYSELWIDPGIRDYYIAKLPALYERFLHSPVLQGTQIWAWSDDSFLLPNAGLEYGREDTPGHYWNEQYAMPGRGLTGDAQWGVVDGWRRRKPEFWHTKKLQSPIRLKDAPLPMPTGTTVEIPVENRYDFLDLADLKISWQLGAEKGAAKASVKPHAAGKVVVDLERTPKEGEVLSLEFRDARGVVDAFRLPFGKAPVHAPDAPAVEAKPLETYGTSMLNGNTSCVVGNGFEIGFGSALGYLRRGVGFGRSLLLSAPTLHIAPTGNPTRPLPDPQTWRATGVELKKDGVDYEFVVKGEYDKFQGTYTYTIKPDGEIVAHAAFAYGGDDVWVRETGLRFEVPKDEDLLRWDRKAEYSVYPADHIGRADGETRAFKKHDLKLPPTWSWSDDDSPMGCNDFRSTKRDIDWGWIGYPDAGPGVLVLSDGRQNLRAMVADDRIVVFVNDLYDGIGSRWEWLANYGRGRLLKKGDRIESTVRLRLAPVGRKGEG